MEAVRFQSKAIRWHSCAGTKEDDVADDKLPGADSFGGTILAPDHGDLFVFDHGLQLDKFLILAPLGHGGDAD